MCEGDESFYPYRVNKMDLGLSFTPTDVGAYIHDAPDGAGYSSRV
jgi:hypothetical protein